MKKVGTIILTLLLLASVSVMAYAADESASIPYEDLQYVAGDVNCDEDIQSDDTISLIKILLGTETAQRVTTADTNGDGDINIIDLIRLKNYFAGEAEFG